jgi:hypothetical protein
MDIVAITQLGPDKFMALFRSPNKDADMDFSRISLVKFLDDVTDCFTRLKCTLESRETSNGYSHYLRTYEKD